MPSEKSGALRVQVDSARCEGHGLCADTAPEVYELDDDAMVVLKVPGDLPDALRTKAEAGARVCPVAALRVIAS